MTTNRQSTGEVRAKMERRADVQYRMQVDASIATTVADGNDPLNLKPLRDYLVSYATYWTTGQPIQHAQISGGYLGPGCMVCGRSPIELFVMTVAGAGILPEDSALWRALWARANRDCGDLLAGAAGGWLPLLNVYQALWRLSPHAYFAGIPLLPLLYMPVLLLCSDCGTLARQTHREIELGTIP